MRFFTAIIVATFLCIAQSATSAAEATGQERAIVAGRDLIGKPGPRMTLTTIDGTVIDLGKLYGKKAVYIKFWATWCMPCRQQMPHFEHAFETAGPDLAVIAVNTGFNDPVDAVKRYRKELKLTMPIVVDDGTLANRFHLRVTPTHIIIGRDGRIQYVGHLADAAVDEALVAARAGVSTSSVGATTSQSASAPKAISVGDLLPARAINTLSGRPMHLRKTRDKQITAILFFSPWCESYLATSRPEVAADCRSIREQVTALAIRSDIRWLGIASGLWANKEDLRKTQSDYQISIPITLDESGELYREFQVNSVPTMIFADSKGRVVCRLDPQTQVDSETVRRAVENTETGGR